MVEFGGEGFGGGDRGKWAGRICILCSSRILLLHICANIEYYVLLQS